MIERQWADQIGSSGERHEADPVVGAIIDERPHDSLHDHGGAEVVVELSRGDRAAPQP